jgi:hypothetical protein
MSGGINGGITGECPENEREIVGGEWWGMTKKSSGMTGELLFCIQCSIWMV